MVYSKELIKRRILNGQCGRCGASPLFTGTECRLCRDKRAARQRQYYKTCKNSKKSWPIVKEKRDKQHSLGLCSRCGKRPHALGAKSCEVCIENQRSLWHKYKDQCYAAYGGYVCVCCGEKTRAFLTLDHINNDGYKSRKESKSNSTGQGLYRWIVRNNFPSIFQVLCYNCNCGRARNNGVCPHKSQSSESSLRAIVEESRHITAFKVGGSSD